MFESSLGHSGRPARDRFSSAGAMARNPRLRSRLTPRGTATDTRGVVYRVSIRANPRILVLFVVIPALPAIGVLLTVLVDRLIGIIGLAAGVYMSYHLTKFLSSHLRSYVETGDDALKCRTTANEEIMLGWSSISHAGQCYPEKGPDYLFVYSKGDDRLLTIPREYSGYEQLAEELRKRVGPGTFRELALTAEESIQDRLKIILGE